MATAPMRRRNAGFLPWLRAAGFAGVTYLASSALGFYPAAVPPVIAIVTGVLGLLAPGIGVLLAVVAIGIPLAAGDIVAGALFLVLGFGCIQYLSDSQGRAFLVISLAFAATVLRAEWGVAVLAGYLLGASEGAVAAFVACLVIQGAGLLVRRHSARSPSEGPPHSWTSPRLRSWTLRSRSPGSFPGSSGPTLPPCSPR
jgi:hypothetical protein